MFDHPRQIEHDRLHLVGSGGWIYHHRASFSKGRWLWEGIGWSEGDGLWGIGADDKGAKSVVSSGGQKK
ncbi:hypothetical protein M404DRAFT_993975 [Pisolithus tinctorius Marx 270]|uniref:Uncharacterized protein n=1 Tax=Pisolithus tinctorius Marx 270 TaxID=870435 RepID=A0A0C3JV41_PISTI|nr:hypothetical protein M404DRAFT_996351 [Pisolithus tinctorius Marx 270]KIO13008.1 hypothetical protein M404DRAFT_993975 [Pisolithus tinctorius Marx 270]